MDEVGVRAVLRNQPVGTGQRVGGVVVERWWSSEVYRLATGWGVDDYDIDFAAAWICGHVHVASAMMLCRAEDLCDEGPESAVVEVPLERRREAG